MSRENSELGWYLKMIITIVREVGITKTKRKWPEIRIGMARRTIDFREQQIWHWCM